MYPPDLLLELKIKNTPKLADISNKIIVWQKRYGRNNLPWQNYNNVYYVWLSEVMLQQTQVKTVLPYFSKFITKFPSLDDLANSELDEILQLWSGLGYYRRAKYLHEAVKKIKNNFKGIFPSKYEDILSLPGIGRSTAGAISAFVYKKKNLSLTET